MLPFMQARELIIGIHAASKRNQPAMGLHFYDAMLAAGLQPNKAIYDSLINLCSGQREWESWSRAAAAGAAGAGSAQAEVLLIKQHIVSVHENGEPCNP